MKVPVDADDLDTNFFECIRHMTQQKDIEDYLQRLETISEFMDDWSGPLRKAFRDLVYYTVRASYHYELDASFELPDDQMTKGEIMDRSIAQEFYERHLEEGMQKHSIEVAEKMIRKGYGESDISEISGLSSKDVTDLRQKLNGVDS